MESEYEDMKIEVMRAEEEWQRAGAYSVRIEGMNRQHHIPLREEFDEQDGPGTRYIVLLDDEYPIATCRFFEPGSVENTRFAGSGRVAMIGRVVVLPEYRGMGLGAKAIREAEQWIRELGFDAVGVDSRVVAVGFYERLGYELLDPAVYTSGPFECKAMIKRLKGRR